MYSTTGLTWMENIVQKPSFRICPYGKLILAIALQSNEMFDTVTISKPVVAFGMIDVLVSEKV